MSDVAIANALRIARRYANGGAVNTDPSPAQKEAGNYKKKHIIFQGIPITIENPKGTIRSGLDHNGKPWSSRMTEDYGYIKRTEGHDGDQVDCFVGPNRRSNRVWVVDQLHHHAKRFDEHKCLLGFNTEKQAVGAYRKSYGKAYDIHHAMGAVTEMSVDAFKEWLKGGGGKKPISPDVPKYQSGGAVDEQRNIVFDPEFVGRTQIAKTPNVRVMEGHQEFEQGYAPSGRSPWNTDYPYRPILNMRGQELHALKIQTGGAVDDSPIEDVPGVGPVPTETYPELAKIPVGLAKEQAEFIAQPRERMEAQVPQMPETGEWTEEQEYLRRAGIAQQAEKEAEFGRQAALTTLGTGAFGAPTGALGVAGGRPPPAKLGPDAVHHWSQAIADALTTKHGDNIDAIESSLNSLRDATSDRAATAIYAKLPEDVQFHLAMREMHPHLRGEGPEPGTVPQPAAPAFREIINPEEAKDWLREHGHDPEDWGYSDPESYVEEANRLKRQEMGLTPPPAPPPVPTPARRTITPEGPPSTEPTAAMGRDDVDQFFGQLSPHEIDHLPPEYVMAIRDKLSGMPDASDYKAQSPQLWNALYQRVDEIEGRTSWDIGSTRPARSTYAEKYSEHIAPHFPDQEEFLHNYFGGMYTPGEMETQWSHDGFYFDGILRNTDGTRIGTITRSFNPESKSAYHGYLKVDEGVRGTGLVPTMLKNQIDLYQKLGIEKVKMLANIDVGAYAWARYGWLPSPMEWNILRNRFEAQFNAGYVALDPKSNWGRSQLLDVLHNPDPRAMWDLSDLNDVDLRSGEKVGKAFLLHRSWGGTLNLKDPATVRRFYDYVAIRAKKKQQP